MNKNEAKFTAVTLTLFLAALGLGAVTSWAEERENVRGANAEKKALDTMLVLSKFARGPEARFLLVGRDGKTHQASHWLPNDMAYTMPKDTVLFDAEKEKIVKNLTMNRKISAFVCGRQK